MTALLRTARIQRRVLETCCHSDSSEKPSAKTDAKNSKGVNNNNNNNNDDNNNNWQDCKREDIDIAKKVNPQERNWISFECSRK